MDLFTESELVNRVRHASLPVVADRLHFAGPPTALGKNADLGYFADEGFSRSWAFGVNDAGKRPYLFIYSGHARIIDDQQLGSLLFDTLRLLQDLVPLPRRVGVLTTREIDCLGWAAAGKSSDEIGTILSLSPHTVNDYLQSAMRKLGATNRTQAVVAAIRRGLL